MNVFLFAPGLFVLLIKRFGFIGSIKKISLCALVQVSVCFKVLIHSLLKVVIGLPFMMENFVGYLSHAFNIGRVFIYYWSVNWKFIPEEIFLSQSWGILLLMLTLISW